MATHPDPAARLDVGYVTHALYERLLLASRELPGRTDPPRAELRPVAEAVLFTEARLLDERRFEDWLELLTDDCINWVPASPQAQDPRTCTSIQFDDRRRLIDRIALERSGHLHAQIPTSRTCRTIGNVEVWDGGTATLRVRSNLVIWEYRHGTHTPHPAWQDHTLVRRDRGWAIRYRFVHLLDCDAPQGNITFFV